MSFLIKHEAVHLAVALLLCVLIWRWYQAWSLIFLLLGVSFLIDVDHLFDCFMVYGFDFSLIDFLSGKYWSNTDQLFVPLHSWELMGLIWLFCWWKKRVDIGLTVSLAMAGHMLVDQFTYTMHPLAYSLIYRAFHDFRSIYFSSAAFIR
jgi:hypothetical protein